ncbi:MAG: hypothetical protein AB7F22_02670 [Reyranella sp.]|uniref:hypothetical protein n=1 Tax=Reyranella sp. TaxID=1929291 RepID=UPI003D0E030F
MKTRRSQSTPLMMSFRGGVPDNAVHDIARAQAEALERLYGKPLYCHLVVKVPEAEGVDTCAVSLYLTLPGHIDLRVEPSDHPDQQFVDPGRAIVDVFQRARGLIAERFAHRRRRKLQRLAAPLT